MATLIYASYHLILLFSANRAIDSVNSIDSYNKEDKFGECRIDV